MCRDVLLHLGWHLDVGVYLFIQESSTDFKFRIDNGGAIHGEEKPHVRGLALRPKLLKSTVYNQAEAKKVLADPCEPSCQNVMLRQMRQQWKWEPEFMLETKIRDTGDGVTL